MFPTAFCGNQFMSDAQQDTILERRVALPEPDVSNITVLMESLPNGPVLPWHHFDSPWLERDDAESPDSDVEASLEIDSESDSDSEEEASSDETETYAADDDADDDDDDDDDVAEESRPTKRHRRSFPYSGDRRRKRRKL